jgi:hypothetical protein
MEVVAGTESNCATWNVPKALLSHHSEFFRTACNNPVKEDIEIQVAFLDYKPRAFQVFIQWIYFATIPFELGFEDGVRFGFVLWTLGDRLLSDSFKNCLMQRMYHLHSLGTGLRLSPHDAEVCWNNTAPSPILRAFFLDTLSLHWTYLKYIHNNKAAWGKTLEKLPSLCQALLALAGTCSEQMGTLESKPVAAYLEGPGTVV